MTLRSKGLSVITSTNILFIFGVFIAIVSVMILIDLGVSFAYGSCYSDARIELRKLDNDMSGAIRSPQSPSIEKKIKLGDCIKGIVFVNGNDKPDLIEGMIKAQCGEHKTYKSYMLAIPFHIGMEYETQEESEGIIATVKRKVKDWAEMLTNWDKLKAYLKKKTGLDPSPICREFEHEFSPLGTDSIPTGFTDSKKEVFNIGTNIYCLKISPVKFGDNDFHYKIVEEPCGAEKTEEK